MESSYRISTGQLIMLLGSVLLMTFLWADASKKLEKLEDPDCPTPCCVKGEM